MENIYRKTIMIMVVLAMVVVLFMPVAMANPTAQLRLETVPAGTYVDDSDDPWLVDTNVTSDTSFDLEIINHNGGSISYIYLLVAVDRVPAGNVTVNVSGIAVSPYNGVITSNNKALVSETNPDYEYPGHGVYADSDTHFEVVNITIPGDVGPTLDAGEHMSVPIEITPLVSAVKVHFDAVGADANKNAISFVPPSHDVTYVVPEFATIAIPAIAILGLFAFYRRKQKK